MAKVDRIAHRLVIKATNHTCHFPLTWLSITVKCLAIVRRFIL